MCLQLRHILGAVRCKASLLIESCSISKHFADNYMVNRTLQEHQQSTSAELCCRLSLQVVRFVSFLLTSRLDAAFNLVAPRAPLAV